MAYPPTIETSTSRVCSAVSVGPLSSHPGIPASPRQKAHGQSQRRVVVSYAVWWPSAHAISRRPAERSAWIETAVVESTTESYADTVTQRCATAPADDDASEKASILRGVSLEIDHVTKRFGTTVALDRLAFDVGRGEVFGFLGANGAGKTTTMRICLGIIRADEGAIRWNGLATEDVPRRTWGYLPEERGLYPRMGVLDQLVYYGSLYGMPADVARRDALGWLERFRISDFAGRRAEDVTASCCRSSKTA